MMLDIKEKNMETIVVLAQYDQETGILVGVEAVSDTAKVCGLLRIMGKERVLALVHQYLGGECENEDCPCVQWGIDRAKETVGDWLDMSDMAPSGAWRS